MLTIDDFCREHTAGWERLEFLDIPGECNFLNKSEGVHLMASVKDYNERPTIHASIGLIRSLRPDMTDDGHLQHALEMTPDVLHTFFGDRGFAMQPDDPRRPSVKHYFHLLREHERN